MPIDASIIFPNSFSNLTLAIQLPMLKGTGIRRIQDGVIEERVGRANGVTSFIITYEVS